MEGKSSKDDYETLHIRCWVRSRVTHMREIQHSPTHLRARKVSTADTGQIHGEERWRKFWYMGVKINTKQGKVMHLLVAV